MRHVGRGATALNLLATRTHLKSQLREIRYRVSVHGTSGPRAIPSFHTQFSSPSEVRSTAEGVETSVAMLRRTTGVSYTAAPMFRTRACRRFMHRHTGEPYTARGEITGLRYTRRWSNPAIFFGFLPPNCTKPSCTKDKTSTTVVLSKWGGVQ